jgi:hypothetical protein
VAGNSNILSQNVSAEWKEGSSLELLNSENLAALPKWPK